MFSTPVSVLPGPVVERDGFVFGDFYIQKKGTTAFF
jgi:hypothetical protein